MVDRYPRTEPGSPPSSSGTSTTVYHAPLQRSYPNLSFDDRYPGQEKLSISINDTRRVVQHLEKEQKHHDSATDVVPFREPESCQLRAEGRRINVDDIEGQDESEEPQSVIHQLHGNARFAVQAALAQSARREQREAVVEGDGRALARSGSGGWGGGGYRSATRAYIERAESWFGQDVLIETMNQMIERQGHGSKSRKRKPQRVCVRASGFSSFVHRFT